MNTRMEFASQGESSHCQTCHMDYSLHWGAKISHSAARWPVCPPVVMVSPEPVRMAKGDYSNIVYIDFKNKQKIVKSRFFT